MIEIEPCPDWYSPLSVIWDEGEDPALDLAPYFWRIVEAVSPLTITDSLTGRQWDYAKELLDRKPEPPDVIGWESRWRNFLEYVWKLTDEHYRRLGKAERAREARARKKAPPPAPPPPAGRLEL